MFNNPIYSCNVIFTIFFWIAEHQLEMDILIIYIYYIKIWKLFVTQIIFNLIFKHFINVTRKVAKDEKRILELLFSPKGPIIREDKHLEGRLFFYLSLHIVSLLVVEKAFKWTPPSCVVKSELYSNNAISQQKHRNWWKKTGASTAVQISLYTIIWLSRTSLWRWEHAIIILFTGRSVFFFCCDHPIKAKKLRKSSSQEEKLVDQEEDLFKFGLNKTSHLNRKDMTLKHQEAVCKNVSDLPFSGYPHCASAFTKMIHQVCFFTALINNFVITYKCNLLIQCK